MSVMVMVRKTDAAEMLTDGSCYAGNSWTLTDICSKQVQLPFRAVMSARGLIGVLWTLADVVEKRCSSFDELIASYAVFGTEARSRSPVTDEEWAYHSIGICGWSDDRDRPECWYVTGGANPVCQPNEPYFIDTVYAGGPFGAVQAFYDKFANADRDAFHAETDGVELMEAMRREPADNWVGGGPGFGCGGFVEHTSVSRQGVATRVIHRWPEDQVGKPIEPLSEAA